jgi:hypothetical protein
MDGEFCDSAAVGTTAKPMKSSKKKFGIFIRRKS